MGKHGARHEANIGIVPMKYQVVLVQTKTIVLTVEGKNSDAAVRDAKQEAVANKHFENRLGAVLCADVKEIKNANHSDNA